MLENFNAIRNRRVARMMGIILIMISLIIQVVEFIWLTNVNGMVYETFVAFVIELVTNAALIYCLVRERHELIEVVLVVLKVFEGTYYPIKSAQRLDTLIHSDATRFDVFTHILFAVSAFSLLIALVAFCFYKHRNSIKAWNIMKILILLSTLLMLISTILYIVETAVNPEQPRQELMEPISLLFLFLGMYASCEYVEEETIYD